MPCGKAGACAPGRYVQDDGNVASSALACRDGGVDGACRLPWWSATPAITTARRTEPLMGRTERRMRVLRYERGAGGEPLRGGSRPAVTDWPGVSAPAR